MIYIDFRVFKAFGLTVIYIGTVAVLSSCSCTFPQSLRGEWIRTREPLSLDFSDQHVQGFIVVEEMRPRSLQLQCLMSTDSYKYVVYSNISKDEMLVMCWVLTILNNYSYHLYDMSGLLPSPRFGNTTRGHLLSPSIDIDFRQVCSRRPSSIIPTILFKKDANESQLRSACPFILHNKATECRNISGHVCRHVSMVFTTYYLLSTHDGRRSCMGFVYRGITLYLATFRNDPKQYVKCIQFRFVGNTSYLGRHSQKDCSYDDSPFHYDVFLHKKMSCNADSLHNQSGRTPPVVAQAKTSPVDDHAVRWTSHTLVSSTKWTSSDDTDELLSERNKADNASGLLIMALVLYYLFLMTVICVLVLYLKVRQIREEYAVMKRHKHKRRSSGDYEIGPVLIDYMKKSNNHYIRRTSVLLDRLYPNRRISLASPHSVRSLEHADGSHPRHSKRLHSSAPPSPILKHPGKAPKLTREISFNFERVSSVKLKESSTAVSATKCDSAMSNSV